MSDEKFDEKQNGQIGLSEMEFDSKSNDPTTLELNDPKNDDETKLEIPQAKDRKAKKDYEKGEGQGLILQGLLDSLEKLAFNLKNDKTGIMSTKRATQIKDMMKETAKLGVKKGAKWTGDTTKLTKLFKKINKMKKHVENELDELENKLDKAIDNHNKPGF